jgi:quercetin dioxygenase-like cupin family protein
MRLWKDREPHEMKEEAIRDYETVGYCLEGEAELWLEGQCIKIQKGDSWIVPKGASHK